MTAGIVFLTKLNSVTAPMIPVYTIRGEGCSGRAFDGVVESTSVALPWAQENLVVNGTCAGSAALHSTMLDPTLHPEVAAAVQRIVAQY
jgi:hypothetical protein